MNVRQQVYKRNRLSGMNQTDSALAAGYSFNYATHRSRLLENVVNADMKEVFEYLGYSDYQIARKYIKKAECTRPIGATILVNKDGTLIKAEDEGVITVDDNNVQLKALDSIAEIIGMRKNKVEHSGEIRHTVEMPSIKHESITDGKPVNRLLEFNLG